MTVLEHLLGAPWTRLVNEGYLVDPRDSKFFLVTEEGFSAADAAVKQTPSPKATPTSAPDGLDSTPTVFISYSWESDEHKQWVVDLAARLRANGINVILDHWELTPGNETTYFMEQNVIHSNFLLLVCTPTYAKKANKREGGVGYEAMIITRQLAQQVRQCKFIPVLREGNFDDSALPVWLGSKMGIDLRGNPYSPREYEKLIRTLHNANVKAPPIGPKPIFTDTGFALAEESLDNAVTSVLNPGEAVPDIVRQPSAAPELGPAAYVVYQTKGPDAHQVEAYVRPTDSTGQNFHMKTSNGIDIQGTRAEMAQRYIMFDLDLRNKGYSRMRTFDGSGGKDFNLP